MSLGAVLSPYPVVGDVVFVAVMVSAVFLRRLGPRGTALGMIAFISYFFALFLHATLGQLPGLVVAVAVGALISVLMRALLQRAHPDRELRRMLSALAVWAAAVIGTLARAIRDGRLDERRRRRLRARLTRSGDVATIVEGRLDAAEQPLLDTIGNDELGVRVLDFQLSVEHLVAVTAPMLSDGDALPTPARAHLAETLDLVRAALQADPGGRVDHRLSRAAARLDADTDTDTDERLDRLRRTLRHTLDSWQRTVEPRPGDLAALDEPASVTADEGAADAETEPSEGLSDTFRQAVQVGVATTLAIVVGELLSPTRWFWAVIAAFVVFTGTSTRGETLSKGWQRVLGTLVGVGAGVLVAALVGGNTVLALALIGVCLFLGFYLMQVSSGIMIFFITTMLALLYGLLGQFSVGLLVLRLEETAAGATIGVLVAALVLPASTRRAAGEALGDFLRDLGELLTHVTAILTGATSTDSSTAVEARALRTSFDTLRNTAKPLTQGLAGLSGRSGFRYTIRVLGACAHHARALARLTETTRGGVAACPGRELAVAVRAVHDHVDAVADGAGRQPAEVAGSPAGPSLDAVEDAVRACPDSSGARVLAAVRHLRAIDQALCHLTTGLDSRGYASSATWSIRE